MFRWKCYGLGLLGLLAIVLAVGRSFTPRPAGSHASSPQRIEEVIQIARELGLCCRGDREDGQVQMRLLVSEAPIPWERVNRLVVGRNEQTDWAGIVAVIQGRRTFPLVGYRMTPWGNFRLHGDPALIQRLTGRSDASET